MLENADIRVYRFSYGLLKPEAEQETEFRTEGPVPIYTDGQKLLGFASCENFSGWVLMKCAIDPSCPERFDLETDSRNYWLDPLVEKRGFLSATGRSVVSWVKALVLTTRSVPNQTPIDPQLGSLS